MKPEEEIKQVAKRAGALVAGIANFDALNDKAPAGHRPLDFLPEAKSVVAAGCATPSSGAMHSPEPRMYNFSKALRRNKRGIIATAIEDQLEREWGYQALQLPVSTQSGFVPWVSLKLCAEEAGLGERGLNNLVMNPTYGPRLEFVAVVTTMPLAADPRPGTNPCPHPECIRMWAREETTYCLDACPSCLSGEIDKGRIKWAQYEQLNCMPRSNLANTTRFSKILEAILEKEDRGTRKRMLYGRDFQLCLEAMASGVETFATCFECQRVCPMGADKFELR
jgi:epoxyqueuosine reductase QueG